MTNKNILTLIILLLSITLMACTRSATNADTAPTQDDIASIMNMRGTLTAEVLSNGEGEGTQSVEDPFAATATPLAVTAEPTEGPTAAPTSPQSVPNTYTLKKREYPYCIARRFNVDIDALMSMNGLTPSSLYEEGLVLTIPQNSGAFKAERTLLPHPTQYTVVTGDSIFWIACMFGDVFPEAIAQANGIELNATLTVGQVLQIP